jgi:hypothetical protein
VDAAATITMDMRHALNFPQSRGYYSDDHELLGSFSRQKLQFADLVRDFCRTVFSADEPPQNTRDADAVADLRAQIHRFMRYIMWLDNPERYPLHADVWYAAGVWCGEHGIHYNDLRTHAFEIRGVLDKLSPMMPQQQSSPSHLVESLRRYDDGYRPPLY